MPKRTDSAVRKKVVSGYHHRDLRRALMDAALAYLSEHDVTRLSMQQLARSAAVSPGAPYHHFADKEAVLSALATEGFEILNLSTEPEAARPAVSALQQLAAKYLDFADAHPIHYRLMFLPEWSDRARFPALHAAAGESLARLVRIVAEGLPSRPQLAMSRALIAFSLLHGFADLRAARVLSSVPGAPSITKQRAQLIERVVVVAFAEA